MRNQWLRRLELMLFGIGTAAAVLFGALSVPHILARGAGRQSAAAVDGPILRPGTFDTAYMSGVGSPPPSSVIGRLRIPALKIDAPVIEGVEDGDLRKGIGHVPHSAMAGGLGNMVLAAHRDGIFRPLQRVQNGMDIRIEEENETYSYKVDSTQVVSPDRVDIMAVGATPEITLITCYPFYFIGSAPLRFIVKAHLVSALPGTVGNS